MSDLSGQELWQSSCDSEAAAALMKFELPELSLKGLFSYCRLLQDYNQHTNLVANSDLSVLLRDHLLDSLRLLPWLREIKSSGTRGRLSLVDVGSGAGFPGMALALSEPDLHVTLVDSVGKKCRFLESVVSQLGLGDRVEVISDRAEKMGRESRLREQFDFASARAVCSLPLVAELCLPFLRIGGLLLAQRSTKQVLDELPSSQSSCSKLGGSVLEPVHFESDLSGRRLSLLVIKKVAPTPASYPRAAAKLPGKSGKR